MAEDARFGFEFKSTEKDGRTKLVDPSDIIKSTVYDATFDPWDTDWSDKGEGLAPTEEIGGSDPALGGFTDSFDFL